MNRIKLGYARVSTKAQDADTQEDRLKEAGCEKVYRDDAVSGAKNKDAEGRAKLLQHAKRLRAEGEEVEIITTALDRYSRSLTDLLASMEELSDEGIAFKTLDGGINLEAGGDSPMNKFVLTIFGAVAEFERSLIKSRMDEAREAKLAKGLRVGRKPSLTNRHVELIKKSYHEEKKTPSQIAKEWKISRTLVGRVLGIYPSLPPYFTVEDWEEAQIKAGANSMKGKK